MWKNETKYSSLVGSIAIGTLAIPKEEKNVEEFCWGEFWEWLIWKFLSNSGIWLCDNNYIDLLWIFLNNGHNGIN